MSHNPDKVFIWPGQTGSFEDRDHLEGDQVCLQHMLDSAKKAVRFGVAGRRETLDDDDKPLLDALVWLIAVIVEAASRVSPGARSKLNHIPWSDIANWQQLSCDYLNIDRDLLWATVQDSLPDLIRGLETAMAAEGE